MLASRYGNPVFPLMNGIFRSAWYPPRNYTDYRFVPADTAQALLYPFRWALSNAPVVSELSLRDARFALAMLMVPLLLACLVKSRVPGKRRALALLVASVLGYVLWLHAIAYLRYAITLEVFASVLFCVTLYHLARLLMPQVQGAASVFAAQLLMALFWHTQVVDWWRVPFGERVFAFDTTALPSGSLVLTVGQPVALALPFLDAPNYRAVGITQTTLDARGYRLYREAVDTIRHHDGPIYVVTDTLDDLNMLPTEAGVALEPAQCRKLPNNITVRETSILLCPAHLQE
jgi:hypothetical protein